MPERLTLPLSPGELVLEGGDAALKHLVNYEGLWVWRIALKKVDRPEAET